jgi:hypothetical protein
MNKSIRMPLLGALGLLATMTTTVAIDTYQLSANAQTAGMVRRQERRATRQQARHAKHECNASGQGSRAQCRQEKHDIKQSGRENRSNGTTSTTTTTNPR